MDTISFFIEIHTLMEKKCWSDKSFFLFAIGAILAILFTSCSGSRQLSYFRNLPDSTIIHLPPTIADDRIIEKGDQLDIFFSARDQEAAGYFNIHGPMASGGGGTAGISATAGSSTPGYEVDSAGRIDLPILGKLPVKGLTASGLKDTLTRLTSSYLKSPLVEVKFVSFRFTVLGEVRSPGTFNLSMQRTTLFEALASAGDLPHTARRYNIRLYRDYNGSRTVTRFDLRDQAVLYDKNVFQIKPNDVLYVEPRPSSMFKDDFGFFTSVFTLLVGIVTLWITVSHYK
jgi:polysaccharide export outer membrane protein